MTFGPAKLRVKKAVADLRSPSGILLWDGGIGTALIARGLRLGEESPESWLLSRADEVAAVHRGFAEAGVDVLQTNTFGLVRLFATDHLPVHPATGKRSTLREIVETGVALARSAVDFAVDRIPVVVGSIGPTGDQTLDEARLVLAYREVAAALVQSGVAALHLETCFDPRELHIALSALRSVAYEIPVLVSVTVTHGQLGLETPLGVPLDRLLRELADDPPTMIGVNCSQNADRMRGAVAALAEWASAGGRRLPVLARPQLHSGSPDCKRPAKEVPPDLFARQLLLLLDEGATAIGGCCGVTAAHLQAVRHAIEGFLSPSTTL